MTDTLTLKWELILNCLLIAWWLASFIPLQEALTKYVKPFLYEYPYISSGISCWKCITFNLIWITGLIAYQEFYFYEAITGALLAYVFERILNSFKTYL